MLLIISTKKNSFTYFSLSLFGSTSILEAFPCFLKKFHKLDIRMGKYEMA